MTLYKILRKASENLSKDHSEELFDYFIHAMDDHGFLRTRYCYWDKIIDDRRVPDDITTILITTKNPFDFENDTEYYVKEGGAWENIILTGLKM